MPSPPRRVRGQVRVRHPRFGEKTISRERLQTAEAGGWQRVVETPKPRRRRRTPQSSAQPDTTPSASTTATDPAPPDDVKEQS